MINTEEIKYIRKLTGCSMAQCKKSLLYAENNLNGRDKIKLSIAYLKSKTMAVKIKGSEEDKINYYYKIED